MADKWLNGRNWFTGSIAVCNWGIAALLLLLSNMAWAQTNRFLQQGNKFYDQQRYKEAAEDYAKALKKDPNNTPGWFNLGNSLYQQKKFDSSRKVMAATEKMLNDKGGKAAANYNIGNSYMSEQKWEDAINSYKRTLRNNPQDQDAKYNLSYAQEMLKKQQDQDKQKKDDKDKKDKDKDKDKKDQKDKDKDKQDKDKENKGDKDEQNKEPKEGQGEPSKLSQQQAENMLNTLQQQEKKLQEKLKKEKGMPVKLQKDW